MSERLQELVAAWLGEETSEERRTALLRELREDPVLRKEFVTEIRTFSMLQAVQSPEPRWLALQDEFGLGNEEHTSFEHRMSEVIGAQRRPFVSSWWRPFAALAACLAVLFAVLFLWRTSRVGTADGGEQIAVAVSVDGVHWDDAQRRSLQAGQLVYAGGLRFHKGKLTLAFLSGVSVHVEGPADLTIIGPDRIACRLGNLRALVPDGAQGFTVETPGAAVTDLGTEFGISVEAGARAQVVVYQGSAEASLLSSDGSPRRTQLIAAKQSVEIDPRAGSIRRIEPRELLAAPDLSIGSLNLHTDYPERVMAAKPLHYWRTPSASADRIEDRVPGGQALRIEGPITPQADGSLDFSKTDTLQFLRMEGDWTPSREFAVELWFASQAFHSSVLGVMQKAPTSSGELVMLELTNRGTRNPLRPGRARFLYRWPPGGADGVNLYSAPLYVPYRWHHLVCQRRGGVLEMYLDGCAVGETSMEGAPDTTACTLRFGRLNENASSPNARQFQGRIAEPAIYERSLTPQEIAAHAEMRLFAQ
jgi:hypothetical protein